MLKNLQTIEENMKLIGAGEGLVFTLKELHRKVTNDALTRDELLFELDEVGESRDTRPALLSGSSQATGFPGWSS